jgi:ABC-type nitrate/sulfonate/bicarbonate transport system permease component
VLIFLAAMVITVIIGSLLGMALGVSATAEDALNPLFQFLRAIPAAAIVPAMTLLLGATTGMSITVIVLASVWPVLLTVRSGMQNLNPLLRDVSATLQLPRRSLLRKVILPSMLPSILLGTRVCAPIALLITLLVQLLTGTSGIGGLLSQAQSEFDSSAVYGYVAISGILSILVSLALRGIERLVVVAKPR